MYVIGVCFQDGFVQFQSNKNSWSSGSQQPALFAKKTTSAVGERRDAKYPTAVSPT